MARVETWPALPARAAYLVLNNASRRNALSREELISLRRQLIEYNTSRRTGRLLLLPPFKEEVLNDLEDTINSPTSQAAQDLGWLTNSRQWQEEREGLPNVIVLRSSGPVFSAGHDLEEMRRIPIEAARDTFTLCAEVMSLIRRSPAPVVGVIQGLATAAGCQLALTTDLPIAYASTSFRLPGASLGLPCSSPSTIVSRRVGNTFGYRMLALADNFRADRLPDCGVEVVPDGEDLEARVAEIVERLASKTAPRPQALAKWGYWTQIGLDGRSGSGDGYEDAVKWTGRVMALHTQSDEAQEGISAFLEKRPPKWKL
jgi:enoyl-CoA hydratase/carnithine racemase